MNRRDHWDRIYADRPLPEASWFQPVPQTSLDFIGGLVASKDAAVIDIGGGDSLLVDHLLAAGYRNLSVLDISALAIARAKNRLGKKAGYVKWVACDINDFVPTEKYDLWHDRAAFHFLTEESEIIKYVETANTALSAHGKMVIGTFSETGPGKCSGLAVHQYDEAALTETFHQYFHPVRCVHTEHNTPSGSVQPFLFCSFKKTTTSNGI